jgi:hypothetical protein
MDEKQEYVIFRRESDGWVGIATVEDWEHHGKFVGVVRTELTRVDSPTEAMRLCLLANTNGENE